MSAEIKLPPLIEKKKPGRKPKNILDPDVLPKIKQTDGVSGKKLEFKEEIIRCGKDPVYFLKNYAKIQHPSKGLIPFNLFPYQEDLIKAFVENRNNIVLKARQLGITALGAGFIAWFILFRRHKNVLVMSSKGSNAKGIIRKIKTIYKYLPKWMFLTKMIENNVLSLSFDNGSSVKATTTSKDAGRSEALSLLFVDEAAWIENFEQLWTGLAPTVSLGGKIIMSSTPNGSGGTFHKIYQIAKNREGDWNCRIGDRDKLMWWERPDYDQAWFDKETAGKSSSEIAQELLCEFLTSGDAFFQGQDIVWMKESIEAVDEFNVQIKRARDPFRREYTDSNMWIWKDPEPDITYIISADVARGDANDYSACHILNALTCEQVAEYKGKIPADLFAELLLDYAKKYNNALLAIENNAVGAAVLIKLKGRYPNLYYTQRNNLDYNDPFFSTYQDATIPGFTMNQKNRPVILAKLEEYIRNRLINVHSVRFINETETFVYHNQRPEAMKGYNDDLIMALAIGVFLRDSSKAYLTSVSQWGNVAVMGISRSTTPIQNKNNQANIFNRGRIDSFDPKTNKIRIGNGETINLNEWLIT